MRRCGLPLLVHAELPALLREPRSGGADPRAYATWLAQPPGGKRAGRDRSADARSRASTGARVHIVHLASPEALATIRGCARATGVPITVETCPHYLTFAPKTIPDGATAFKCAPPIRERGDRDGLWQRARATAQIDLVATDHSPAPPALKHLDDGDFMQAWGGIASLQIGVCRRVDRRGAARPADRAPRAMDGARRPRGSPVSTAKGAIAVGHDADLVIFDPDAELIVDPRRSTIAIPSRLTRACRFAGECALTLLRGQIVFDESLELQDSPVGVRSPSNRRSGSRKADRGQRAELEVPPPIREARASVAITTHILAFRTW